MPRDILHLWLTFGIAVVAIVAVLITMGVTVAVFRDEANGTETIVAVMGATTTVVGTLAGLVAGNSVGSAGRERAEERAEEAQNERTTAKEGEAKLKGFINADATPGILEQAKQAFPDLFP